ncbi:hypothetical protein [Rhizobium sp. 18055]|uniref:hypothetical protein n=1 Tax=Rhizobium sp. 18055 TaxID=2681403 RepID=UPI001FCE9716|nr:hypothetical protein [Rhizobium sp. 18055]
MLRFIEDSYADVISVRQARRDVKARRQWEGSIDDWRKENRKNDDRRLGLGHASRVGYAAGRNCLRSE